MKKLDLKQVPKLKPNPIFKGLPKALKDPESYEKTEKELQSILKSDHKHKTASSYVKCKECQGRYAERKKFMKKLGFKSIQQYMEWKKIMTIIKNKANFQIK
jgi:predicted metal-binding transcription factor (methanogenesis marker protein 9)